MAGTREGGLKAAEKIKKRFGKDFYKNAGRKGGTAAHPNGRGFAINGKASEAGRKGGLISRRGSAKK